MKQTLLVLSVGILFVLVLLPTRAMAFWPFDFFGGQVKGETTATISSGIGSSGFFEVIRAYMSRFFNGTPPSTIAYPPTATPSGTPRTYPSPYLHPTLPVATPTGTDYQALIDKAVAAGKITQNQGAEMLRQMTAIREKQQELTQLQSLFSQWMRANNITTAIFSTEPHATTSPSPHPTEPHVTTIRPTYMPATTVPYTGTRK